MTLAMRESTALPPQYSPSPSVKAHVVDDSLRENETEGVLLRFLTRCCFVIVSFALLLCVFPVCIVFVRAHEQSVDCADHPADISTEWFSISCEDCETESASVTISCLSTCEETIFDHHGCTTS